MRIGPMKQRIIIQRFTTTYDSWNQPIETWMPILDDTDPEYDEQEVKDASVWADVHPLNGKELWAARAVQADVEGRITIRYNPDLKATDRVIYQGRVLEILSFFHPKEDKRTTQILYKEEGV